MNPKPLADSDSAPRPRGKRRDVALQTGDLADLPAILAGSESPAAASKVHGFYNGIAKIFEAWVHFRESPHTRRARRSDVMQFVSFLGLRWPEDAPHLLRVPVSAVLAWRELQVEQGRAPKTYSRRISHLSSFYKYLGAAAAEMRLPVVVPNPAHAQFIARANTDPVEETRALTKNRARQLMSSPVGESPVAYRDRAALAFLVYTGARIGTATRLKVRDFHFEEGDEGEATVRVSEKGKKKRTIGIHSVAADAIREYLAHCNLDSGPLFRARRASRSDEFGESPISAASMYRLVQGYLRKLPGARKDGMCLYTPHSLRATTATLLLDAGVDIVKVQELLGHRHVTTTQIYDKRRRSSSESASHDVPI